MITKLKHFLLGFILATSLANQASAEDKWEYTLSPLYLWGTSMEGESQIGPVTAPVSVKFSDAVGDLESVFTIHFEANKGNKGVLINLMHIALTPGATLPNGAPLSVDLTNNILDVAGIYRPQNTEKIEVLYGLRYSDYEMDATIGPMPTATLADQNWIDGFVGLRTNISVSDNSRFILRGDIGAGDSDLTWSASGLFDYSLNNKFSALIGYRWLYYDLEQGSGADLFSYDITYQGPVLAAVFHW